MGSKENKRYIETPATVMRRAFMSFNLWPDNYERYMEIIEHRSDAEAIASHWRAVGEYFSYDIASHIVEHGDERQRSK